MRSFILMLFAVVGLTAGAFAQERSTVAAAPGKKEVVESKTSGNYSFTMPEGITRQEVEDNSKYYTRYFTVKYSESDRKVSIAMVTNDEKSRHVIIRFMVACGVSTITMDGKEYPLEDFFTNFML